MSISKTKIKGNEFRYSDSLHYEWYVKFKDGYTGYMFSDNGDDIPLHTVYEHRSISQVIEIGIVPFSQEKADNINENQSHHYMVIASNNIQISIVIDENQIMYPYIMRRKMNIDNNLHWVHILGVSSESDMYIMIRDTTGEQKNVSSKSLDWIV